MKRFSQLFFGSKDQSLNPNPVSPDAKCKGGLSHRGEVAKDSLGELEQMLEVFKNTYDPIKNPDGYINIGVSENFVMFDEATDFLNSNFSVDKIQCSYGTGATGSPELKEALSKFWNEHFRPSTPVEPGHVLCSAGLTAICEMLGWSLADRGDAILMSAPIYGTFQHDFTSKASLHVEHVSTGSDHPTGLKSVQHYEKAILDLRSQGINTRVLLLCNPHNPLGSFYTEETLIAFCNLCAKYDLHLISDEVYALSVYPTSAGESDAGGEGLKSPFVSLLSLPPDSHSLKQSHVHVMYGFSKDFALSGMRIGCLISQSNQALLDSLNGLSFSHYPSSLSDRMAVTILEDKAWLENFISLSRKRLRENYDFVTSIFEKSGIEYFGKGERWMSGLYIWFDLSPYLEVEKSPLTSEKSITPEAILAARLFEAKVFVSPGASFASDKPGWFRIIHAQERQILKEGLHRILTVIKGDTFARQVMGDSDVNGATATATE